jgi:hypothetical protein
MTKFEELCQRYKGWSEFNGHLNSHVLAIPRAFAGILTDFLDAPPRMILDPYNKRSVFTVSLFKKARQQPNAVWLYEPIVEYSGDEESEIHSDGSVSFYPGIYLQIADNVFPKYPIMFTCTYNFTDMDQISIRLENLNNQDIPVNLVDQNRFVDVCEVVYRELISFLEARNFRKDKKIGFEYSQRSHGAAP